jgi:riboflavin kinase / FMN adenylyltransferase
VLSVKLYRTLGPTSNGKPLALAIGNFDGVHLGHQAILRACSNTASIGEFGEEMETAALSFSPLPREYFAKIKNDPSLAPPRLMSATEKLAAFKRAGIEHVFIPHFGAAFSGQSPEEFIARLVAMNVRWLMVGEDFRFGAKRVGDVAMLRTAGLRHGFQVETMADVECNGQRVSSTAIRTALAAGDLRTATQMLGRPYRIIGRVTHGKKLGRTLGFPTANVALTGRKPALAGVFAVRLRLVTRGLEGVAGENGSAVISVLNGVANLGTNPVVSSENRLHLEVFLFDFSSDLYGQRVEVEFIEKIRDEQNFSGPDSLNALVVQMHDDCDQAKRILSAA